MKPAVPYFSQLIRWLSGGLFRAEYQRGYDDCRAAYFSGYVPLLKDDPRGEWRPKEVVGYVKPGYEWIAEKASRQNAADYAPNRTEDKP